MTQLDADSQGAQAGVGGSCGGGLFVGVVTGQYEGVAVRVEGEAVLGQDPGNVEAVGLVDDE